MPQPKTQYSQINQYLKIVYLKQNKVFISNNWSCGYLLRVNGSCNMDQVLSLVQLYHLNIALKILRFRTHLGVRVVIWEMTFKTKIKLCLPSNQWKELREACHLPGKAPLRGQDMGCQGHERWEWARSLRMLWLTSLCQWSYLLLRAPCSTLCWAYIFAKSNFSWIFSLWIINSGTENM